ncbi:MAG: PH domain-containing protein [Saprospiraceae bacterium]|nr:PH domain-containing protein [Saprospiraceae bacterium]
MSSLPQFENIQIQVEDLPQMGSLDLQPLESNYKYVRLIGWAIFAIIVIVAITIVMINVDDPEPRKWISITAIPVLSVLVIFSFVVAYFGFFQMGYSIRSRDIIFKKGLIWRKTTIIPFNRIQHCEVNHGPIDRIFNLSSLKVFTAGGQASDLEIPGLTEVKAQMIKDYIIGKAGLDEEE